jgi:hypothetical protein
VDPNILDPEIDPIWDPDILVLGFGGSQIFWWSSQIGISELVFRVHVELVTAEANSFSLSSEAK